MDSDSLWHSLGGGAIIAAALTLARLLLEYGIRGGDRRLEQEDRRRGRQRDAEARLERVLQDRLAEADRRLERFELDVHAERARCATLEHDNARLMEAYELLRLQYDALRADRVDRADRALRAGHADPAATLTAAEHARRGTRT